MLILSLSLQYLHCGDDPEQRPTCPELRSFVVSTLKLVDLIKDIVAKASVFEEEDFQPLTYGFQVNKYQSFSKEEKIFGLECTQPLIFLFTACH